MQLKTLEKALSIIHERKNTANNNAYYNKTKALEDEQFKILYLQYVDKMINDAKNDIDDNQNLEILKKQCQNRLKELNLGEIEPVFTCSKCNDTGYLNDKYCDCLIEEINKILKKESGFQSFEDFDNANFEIFADKEKIEKLYSLMQKWCNSNFDKTIVLLSGQTGVGKTHLMKCMANELIKNHKIVKFTTSFAMHQDFVKSYSTRDPQEQQNILSKYLDPEVLFIDDLGTELNQRNITVSYLYQVLNERKVNKLPTIISTNLNLDDIMEYYDERIFSRIADQSTSICLYIEGEDLRIKKD